MNRKIYNTIIIGSGPSGYTAAIYAARALLKPLMITGSIYGGQLMNTSEVENFPGYPNGIDGPMLMSDLHSQAERFGTEFVTKDVLSIDTNFYPYKVETYGQEYLTKSIIISTGSSPLWLNIEGEEKLKSRGLSTCATCDGAFFQGENIIVVGGGDSAMEEANFLTRYAKKVTIIHRREEFRASKIMLERVKNNEKIEIKTNKVVREWIPDDNDNLGGVIIKDVKTGVEECLKVTGAFIAIGHKPNTSFLQGTGIKLDTKGYIEVNNTLTNMKGIFACGDVCDKKYKQAITAAGEGCKAALECTNFLEE